MSLTDIASQLTNVDDTATRCKALQQMVLLRVVMPLTDIAS